MNSYVFPSVVDSHNEELKNVAPNLLNGMKIYEGGSGYLVGNLAFSEGLSPHKIINGSPSDLGYRLLVKAGLLLAAREPKGALTVTMGLPFSTYQLYRKEAVEVATGEHEIEYETSSFGGEGKARVRVIVKNTEVIPEIIGCVIGERHGEHLRGGNFFIASLGYGTFEAILSTDGGIIQRSAVSTPGLRYANTLLMNELTKNHYLGLRSEHQIDIAIKEGFLVTNRKKVDIREMHKSALRNYYNQVIHPELRNAWTDVDFAKTSTLVLTGGGALYSELLDCFKNEFEGILSIVVSPNPLTLASTGYYLHSLSLTNGNHAASLGLDVGNSLTAVTVM